MPGPTASTQTPKVSVVLEAAAATLAAAGIESAQLDAQLLLAAAARVDRAPLLSGSADLSPETLAQFEAMMARRQAREPVAYILGRREFFSLAFEVNREVLIPRPHTETVVDVALEFIAEHRALGSSISEPDRVQSRWRSRPTRLRSASWQLIFGRPHWRSPGATR